MFSLILPVRLGWLLALGLAGSVLAACVAPASSPQQPISAAPEILVTQEKPDDRVLVTFDQGLMIVDVWSDSGIGSAVISLVSGQMPQQLSMRFHLGGLEQMTFAYDDTVITLAVSSRGDGQVLREATVDEQPVEVTSSGPYWMDVERVAPEDDVSGGYFEIAAPQAFYDAAATMFLIAWIDFYR